MVKPIGSDCNLRCDYCYYLGKTSREGSHAMTDRMLEAFVRQYIESQTCLQVLFTWHGGEPMLRPLSFYQKAVGLQRRYAGGRIIDNCIQTNGTLITDEWCRFLHDNGWLVGLSIDGPEPTHDHYRHTISGHGTHERVMRAARMLDEHKVEWNAMATINSHNVADPKGFYQFFKDIGCHYIQFTPIVERLAEEPNGSMRLMAPDEEGGRLSPQSITPDEWGGFLCGLFDEWVKEDVGNYFIQLFEATLACWCGVMPGMCSMAPTCGQVGVMEPNGDLYSCDHFVFPRYKLGNISQSPVASLMYGARQRAFGAAKRDSLPRQCKQCRFLFACHGECPKNRFAQTMDGERGLNYLCAGYRRYFAHVAPFMDYMRERVEKK